MASYFIVGRGLDGESKQYLSKVLSSLMDSSQWDIINVSADSDSQEISSMKAAIRNANPKVLLSLGAEVSKILNENIKFINSARGKLLDYTDGNYTVKMVVTYSPKYLLAKDVTMESLGPVFLRDIEYAIKYVKGELVDISKKNLQYAKTFEEFKAYYDSYLKDAELPAYDIETNAKDPRSNAFRIVGYSLAPNGDTGIYIIREALGFKMPEDDWQKCVGLTKQYLTSRPVLVHNIMYERPATLNEWGIDISRFEDSLIKARLMLGGKIGAGLKEQCEKNLGYPDWDTDLHVYLDSLDSLQQKIKPTTKGKEREEYTILKGKGFAALYSLLKEKQERCDRFLAERGIPNAKGLTAEDKQEFDKIKLDSRLTALKEAMEALTEVVALYYPEPAEILEMIGKEAINLVDIQHDGILPYSSVPINIITRYGALDSVGTQDLNAFLSKRMDKESTPEVNLWQGYEILKANFQVGTEMELQGLYWNDSVASVLKEWLNEKAYTAIINLLRSGFLDKNIFENSRSVLLSFIKAELHTRVKEIVGEFELMNSGIKPLATGKRITWLQLLERLPKEYIDSHYEQIVAYVKENLTNKELYPDYTSMLDIFNPSSYLNVSILKDIFLTPDLQKANGVKEVIALVNSGLEIDKVPYPDRSLYESYQALVKHNEAIDSGEKEGEKISAYTIYKQIAEGLFDIHARTQELQDIQKRAATYNLEDTSESTIVSIYENMVVMGCDIEDESTWTDEFRFLVSFRIFKKCLKLINVYIDGAKIGRGAVWVVNRNDLLDPDKKFAPRKRRYTSEIAEDETYIIQSSWGVCSASTLRWRGGIHTLPAGPMVKGIYTSRYKGGVIAAPDYCLTGDTEVLLLDNTKKCLSELEGVEEFFVYSYDEKTKKVVVGRGHDCRIVRTVDETIKLTFDDNSSIECSADHTFMKLSEQKFVKAEDLSVGDTIQTLQLGRCEDNFRRTKDNKVLVVGKGRLEVENLDGSKTLVQALANDWNLANEVYSGCDKPMHIHHKDENPDNNDPRNLAYITGSQHNRNHAKEQWSNTERLYSGQTFREKMTEVATKVFAPLRLGINKNPVNIEKRRQGNLKVHEARFAQGLDVMLHYYSAEALVIRFNHGAEYDSELRTLLGVTRLPKGMGYRTLNSLKTTFIDYLENLTDNPITKKNLSLIREIRAKLPVNGVSGQDLFKAIIDHNLSLERFEDSRQYLVQNNLLPSNNHVTLSYVEKAFGSIENFYLWHTYFADTYITGYRSQNPLKVMLSSDTKGQVTEAKVYDHKSAYSRLSYRVYFTDNEFLEVAPGQRIRTASGVYKYPEELGGYSVMSHYLKETENNTVKVAKYNPSLSRAVVKIEKVFYPASVEFEHFSIDKDHNYLVPVYTDESANNLNVVLHNDSQHRYITKIERLKYDTSKELYCFTVDHYHNFFTGQGVLTHQSQQEIRTISGLANCQSLLEAYRNGEDVHMKTAMSVFKKPAEEITKNERRFCKSATFAILYGSTVPGLANLMSVPIEQAQQMMDGFFGAYPELKTWMDARHAEIDRGQKVSCSKVGYFLDIDVNGHGGIEEAYKQAGNYPVQGQSSLIAGYVLNSISQYLLDNHMMTKPISFIHDSLEFDIHPSELFKSCQKITSMMNDIPNEKFGIPSKAELTIGLSMGDENEVTFIEETENGGIIELQGFENDLDAMLENWKSVYSSVEYKDDPEFAEDVYVPRKEMFMPKLTISKYSGTTRKMIRRRFEITF